MDDNDPIKKIFSEIVDMNEKKWVSKEHLQINNGDKE